SHTRTTRQNHRLPPRPRTQQTRKEERMSDKRPWAKIDVAYMLNPKWFEIERQLRDSKSIASANAVAICDSNICHELAITNAVRAAREAHLASILYCKQHNT